MRIARLVAAASAAVALAVLTTGSPALAHNSLTKAVPAKNATLTEPPARIELSFLQKVDAKQLVIEVADAQKAKVAADRPEADGKKGTLPLTGTLANGIYTVTYRVVSEDGHPVKGTYTFTVTAPVATSSPSASSPALETPAPVVTSDPPATLAASTTSDDGPNWALIIGILVALVLIAAGAVLALRRRRDSPL
jgi:copper resistance protein C